METRTRINLEAALSGEALAALRYILFAERAEADGQPEVATLFRAIGRQERTERFIELGGDEHRHADILRGALATLNAVPAGLG